MTRPHLGAEAMTAPNDVGALVERGAKAIYEARGLDKATQRSWWEATEGDKHYCRLYATAALEGALATIAALQAEVERAIEEREAAERIIGMLMSLCINVGGWISRGLSETATNALRSAQADGWAEMGWKTYRARSASRKGEHPMSGASEVPAIPEDVRKLAGQVVFDFLEGPTGQPQAQVLRDLIAAAIMADRIARPVDTGREKALEERKDRERQIRVSEYRRAVEWLHGRAKAMNDRHARAVLDLAGDEYGRARSRALANPENGRG